MPPAPTGAPLPPEIPPDEANAKLDRYYARLKNIPADKRMGSVTKSDIEYFYMLMQNPNQYTIERIENIFELLQQLASTEAFEDQELAQECVRQIGFYREELGL